MIINISNKDFKKHNKKILQDFSNISFLYGDSMQRYYNCISSQKFKKIDNKSFLLVRNSKPIAAFYGALLEDTKKNLSTFEIPCTFLFKNNFLTASEFKTILDEFNFFFKIVDGNVKFRDFLIDGDLNEISKLLISKGAKEIRQYETILDLRSSEEELWRNLRKSYKSLINWGNGNLSIKIYDNANITWDVFQKFIELHKLVTGKLTRPIESWKEQYEMVRRKEAFVITGMLEEKLISAGFFIHNNSITYYAVSASNRNFFNKPVFHSIIWNAMMHSKKIGCKNFCFGQTFKNNLEKLTKKEKDVAFFKSGFGGEIKSSSLINYEK